MDNDFRIRTVKEGPIDINDKNIIFPGDKERNWSFTVYDCFRRLPNDEKIKRTWLTYSKTKDMVYCFCCKLFNSNAGSLTGNGCRSWKGVLKILFTHELSHNHINMCK